MRYLALLLSLVLFAHFRATGQSRTLTTEAEFTKNCEGPAVDSKGNVYAVNFVQDGSIGQITSKGKTSFFIMLPKGSTGNGIRFGGTNTFYIADFTGHKVLKADLGKQTVKLFADVPQMNQPNDLAITRSGLIYCSDPDWKNGTGQVWVVSADGKARLAAENMGTTNGIEVSPDEKLLYVNESVQRNIWVFDIHSDGSLSNKRLLIQFPDGGLDGMRCDIKGNLYVTRYGKGEVAIVSPTGTVLKAIATIGKNVSNIAFGGRKGTTCYVTLQDRGCIETFKSDFAGREWQMMKEYAAAKRP